VGGDVDEVGGGCVDDGQGEEEEVVCQDEAAPGLGVCESAWADGEE